MKIKMAITVGVASFLLVVVMNSYIGMQATNQLGQMLEYLGGPAWDTADGAMEGQIGIQQEIISMQRLYHAEISAEQADGQLADAGADVFVAGSAVFNADNRNLEIAKLRELAHNH